MTPSRAHVRALMEMMKLHRRRETLIRQAGELTKRERSFITWLAMLESAAFRPGDNVVIDNPKDQFRIAVVRFTKTNTSGQTWVYITTLNGKKTCRLPRNLRKIGK